MEDRSSITRNVARARFWFGWLVALVLVCAGRLPARAAPFTVALDRYSIVLGETVTLTISFEGAQPQEVSALPAIDGIQVASGVSSQVNTSMDASGAKTLIEAVRRLDGAAIELSDIGIHRATLDDVFLSLTGQPVVEEEPAEGKREGKKKR